MSNSHTQATTGRLPDSGRYNNEQRQFIKAMYLHYKAADDRLTHAEEDAKRVATIQCEYEAELVPEPRLF